jgi:hypothetical protein
LGRTIKRADTMKKSLLIAVIIIMTLPVNVQSAEIITTTITTFPQTTHTGQVIMEENMLAGSGQVMIMPDGSVPDMGMDTEIIESNITGSQWNNITVHCTAIKDRAGNAIDASGAVTIQVYYQGTIYANAVLGAGESELSDVSIALPSDQQSMLAISVDRTVPAPLIPIPLDQYLNVEISIYIGWALAWELAYRDYEPNDPNGGGIGGIDFTLPDMTLASGIAFILFGGIACAYMGNKRKDEEGIKEAVVVPPVESVPPAPPAEDSKPPEPVSLPPPPEAQTETPTAEPETSPKTSDPPDAPDTSTVVEPTTEAEPSVTDAETSSEPEKDEER